MLRGLPVIFVAMLLIAPRRAATEASMPDTEQHHASGTFTVKIEPRSPSPAAGLSRYSIDKIFSGDLTGTSQGEMISAGDPSAGAAGYVAIEVVTGTLGGRHGTFALQQAATMHAGGRELRAVITPGSGTDGLKGLAGTATLAADATGHRYTLDYTLPQ